MKDAEASWLCTLLADRPSWEGGDGVPDGMALAEITCMPLGMELPALGAFVSGEVYWHNDRNHQVRVWLGERQGADA
ncbi:hypothetical protein [Streptomyces sp. sk2.1]|uniref:hypothetical protein n=1 Tax=Streptomyces sp. sk2.1 TaxID=2478959 RepID=UPI0011E6C907|nr:hypothetical protein [Streptomyces sp. sk2.1]